MFKCLNVKIFKFSNVQMFDTKCLPSLAAFATRPVRGLAALPLVVRYPAGEKTEKYHAGENTKGIRVACSIFSLLTGSAPTHIIVSFVCVHYPVANHQY